MNKTIQKESPSLQFSYLCGEENELTPNDVQKFDKLTESGRNTAECLSEQARRYSDMGRLDKAEETYKKALFASKKTYGECHSITAALMENLANIYYGKGLLKEAEKLHDQSLEIVENGGTEEDMEGSILNNQAIIYQEQGRHKEAMKMYKRAIKFQESYSLDGFSTAKYMNNLAHLYIQQGRYQEAFLMLTRALTYIGEGLPPCGKEVLGYIHMSLFDLHKTQNQRKSADLQKVFAFSQVS